MIASGPRFGRISIASPAANPENAAEVRVVPMSSRNETAHAADTGTSDIGCGSMKRKIGLDATSAAAASPAFELPSRRPSKHVVITSTAPEIGTTQNIAQKPAIFDAPAMSSGKPGG